MRSVVIPSGVSRLVSKTSRIHSRGDFLLPFPDYPCNARSFVQLDARLLPYWHTLFDVCPGVAQARSTRRLEHISQFYDLGVPQSSIAELDLLPECLPLVTHVDLSGAHPRRTH